MYGKYGYNWVIGYSCEHKGSKQTPIMKMLFIKKCVIFAEKLVNIGI
jgi:hypothetical protein